MSVLPSHPKLITLFCSPQPFLTIVLNNGGWNSPKLLMLGMHPNGDGLRAPPQDINVTFGPDNSLNPDYGGIAAAAGGAWSRKVRGLVEIDEAMRKAVQVVAKEKRCALINCWLERF